MNRMLLIAALSVFAASNADAAVGLINVPAMCGPSAEVLSTLAIKMPNPEEIGKGGNSRGEEVATLFAGNGYWALIAVMSPDSVCVVASGSGWTVTPNSF